MKTYEALLMSTHNICFHGEIRKNYVDIPLYLELCSFAKFLPSMFSIKVIKEPDGIAVDKDHLKKNTD